MCSSEPPAAQPEQVLRFWVEAGPSRWFRKDAAFDDEFRSRFLAAHQAARRGELDTWARSPQSCLALLILLDQFPRNAFRGTAAMFETDSQALAIARDAVDAGFDAAVDPSLRNFFFLPFMHSENLADQERGVALALQIGGEELRFALMHRDIIRRFGRFPHRNALLGRSSTQDEQRFLDEGGFSG